MIFCSCVPQVNPKQSMGLVLPLKWGLSWLDTSTRNQNKAADRADLAGEEGSLRLEEVMCALKL